MRSWTPLLWISAAIAVGFAVLIVPLDAQNPTQPEMELLHGFHITPDEVVLYVTSSGCTRKEHFRLNIAESLPLQLTVRRVHVDNCRAFSREVEIRFSKSELGLTGTQPLVVTNPFDSAGLVRVATRHGHPAGDSQGGQTRR